MEKFIPEECLYFHGGPLPQQRGKTKSSIFKQVGKTILDEGDGIIFAVPRIPSILTADTTVHSGQTGVAHNIKPDKERRYGKPISAFCARRRRSHGH